MKPQTINLLIKTFSSQFGFLGVAFILFLTKLVSFYVKIIERIWFFDVALISFSPEYFQLFFCSNLKGFIGIPLIEVPLYTLLVWHTKQLFLIYFTINTQVQFAQSVHEECCYIRIEFPISRIYPHVNPNNCSPNFK